MKNGKYYPIGDYKNIRLGYGTIDFKNLKTIYIKFNSWLNPKNNDDEYDNIISASRRKIKEIISKNHSINFKPQCIVDLDIKSKGIKKDKKSFMSLEVTLYVDNKFDIKSCEIKEHIKCLSHNIIDDALIDKNLYNFNKTKN